MKLSPALMIVLLGAIVLMIQRANAATTKGFVMTAANNPTVTSPAGIAFLKRREGFSAKAYPDGPGKMSIGYGHQIIKGDGLTPLSVLTEPQGAAIFLRDLASREALLRNNVRAQVTQQMFDALMSLLYNIGNDAFLKSTLLKKLNAKDYAGAAAEFLVWDKNDTQNVERRKMEAAIFGGGAYA